MIRSVYLSVLLASVAFGQGIGGGLGLDVPPDATITNAKLSTMATKTIKGNASGSTAAPSDLSLFSVQDMLFSRRGTLAPTNGGSVTPDVSLGFQSIITLGASVATFTVVSPTGSTTNSTLLLIKIVNSSGGASAATFDSTGGGSSLGFQLAGAWVDPANGKNRWLLVAYNSSSGKWQEIFRSAADIAN